MTGDPLADPPGTNAFWTKSLLLAPRVSGQEGGGPSMSQPPRQLLGRWGPDLVEKRTGRDKD